MSQLLERMERQATILAPARRYTPITDIDFLAQHEAEKWRALDRELREGGDPTALVGGIAGIESRNAQPLSSAGTATSGTTEVQLWDPTKYTPISARESMVYDLYAEGTGTTGATPGTWTLTPRIGTSTSGVSLGASAALTLTASITAFPWILKGIVTIRDLADANNTMAVKAVFEWKVRHSAASAGTFDTDQVFGFTVITTADPTLNPNSLFMGSTASNAGSTFTAQQIRWGSWN